MIQGKPYILPVVAPAQIPKSIFIPNVHMNIPSNRADPYESNSVPFNFIPFWNARYGIELATPLFTHFNLGVNAHIIPHWKGIFKVILLLLIEEIGLGWLRKSSIKLDISVWAGEEGPVGNSGQHPR